VNKCLLTALLMLSICPLYGDMVYDPIQDIVYSTPQTADINNTEYMLLLHNIGIIGKRIDGATGKISSKAGGKQLVAYLQRIGTPTALRLIKDCKKGVIYFPDGSVCRKLR
jgi:hypothetical protein